MPLKYHDCLKFCDQARKKNINAMRPPQHVDPDWLDQLSRYRKTTFWKMMPFWTISRGIISVPISSLGDVPRAVGTYRSAIWRRPSLLTCQSKSYAYTIAGIFLLSKTCLLILEKRHGGQGEHGGGPRVESPHYLQGLVHAGDIAKKQQWYNERSEEYSIMNSMKCNAIE
jgi:hypothetical protein